MKVRLIGWRLPTTASLIEAGTNVHQLFAELLINYISFCGDSDLYRKVRNQTILSVLDVADII